MDDTRTLFRCNMHEQPSIAGINKTTSYAAINHVCKHYGSGFGTFVPYTRTGADRAKAISKWESPGLINGKLSGKRDRDNVPVAVVP